MAGNSSSWQRDEYRARLLNCRSLLETLRTMSDAPTEPEKPKTPEERWAAMDSITRDQEYMGQYQTFLHTLKTEGVN